MKLLIIIITYNSEKWIKKNLDSIGQGHDLLIIDNGSIDNTLEIIKNEYPAVRLIESEINLGFAKANNLGFEIAKKEKYDWVFMVNHDAWLAKDCLFNMKNFLLNSINNEYDILSPIHLSGDNKSYDFGFERFCDIKKLEIFQKENKILFDVNEVNGAFMMISIKCLSVLKGFDPLFFFYGEDTDLCFRAIKNNFKIGIITNAIAYHDRKNRKDDFNRKKNRIIANHLIQFKQINGGFWLSYLKTLFSAIIGLINNYRDNFIYIELIKYLVINMNKLRVSYKEFQ